MLGNYQTDLAGQWQARLSDGSVHAVRLPGSLDENGVGAPDKENLDSRLTRLHVYEGPAAFSREAVLQCAEDKRLFLLAERSRELSLMVDGATVVPARTGSLSTPYTFELTRFADGKAHTLTLTSDNSYPSGGYDEIVYSSAATDETQTNWNGILGTIALYERPAVFADQIRLLTSEKHTRVCVTVDAAKRWQGELRVSSDALAAPLEAHINVPMGRTDVWLDAEVSTSLPRWDELDGHLSTITATIDGMGAWTQACGVRTIGSTSAGRLTLNGRVFFLRGEANCAEFPETGHAPMTVDEWKQVLGTYAAYGVNYMRFHSHCPPDAAFTAADEMGMMMQPELSHWDPYHAFENEESYRVYRNELMDMIRALGHHPSFVMLSLGNELHANAQGIERMHSLLREARQADDTRLYAWGSNNFYGRLHGDPESDFYTSMACGDNHLRATSSNMVGALNEQPPCTDYTYDAGVKLLRESYSGPVFGFEVGQYEVLPDFDEIADFKGVTRAVNYEIVQDRVRRRGLEAEWKKQVEATGEMSLMCYREEVESVFRTRDMSGLCLLGLQDFPGQGTALVGMLNAHLQPKPFDFAKPERFAAFFRPVLPLAMLSSRCFGSNEQPTVSLALANYGKDDLYGALRWELSDGNTLLTGELPTQTYSMGQVTDAGTITLPLSAWTNAAELTLTLRLGEHENSYCLWVYPDEQVVYPDNVLVTSDMQEALTALREGKRVLLDPEATHEAIPQSITSQFSPDFWSVGNFPQQEGAMGCMMDVEHPIFRDFPTRVYSTWQWWQPSKGRAIKVSPEIKPIVKVLDCYKFLRPLALLFECRVGSGLLMLSGMGLHQHQDRIEIRALTSAVLRYMASDAFGPQNVMTEADLTALFTADTDKKE